MSRQLQPSVPLVTLVKTEPPTVIKNEPPEEAFEKEISPDIKDIVYHSLSEYLIKNETVPESILETKYSESVETQVLVKTEDTRDENVTKGTDQEVIEVQGSHEHSNTLSNLETHEQLFLNSSKDLNGIGTRSRKAKHVIKTDFAQCYKTDGTTSWKEDKEKIKVIKAPVIPVEAHEYTSLAKDRHVCNHCQYAFSRLNNLKHHIRTKHRKVTTMYQCPYCSYKSKWNIQKHIISKHRDTKDIQWFQCNFCEKKFKLKDFLTQHMNIHLRHKLIKDGLDLREKREEIQYFKNIKQRKRYGCNKCNYRTDNSAYLKRHNLVHLKPEEIEYFYCYHCSSKCQRKDHLKSHIFRHHFKNVKQEKRYGCNKCNYETYRRTHLKGHKLIHLKPEEIQYFYCYHCSYKAKRKGNLKEHIFMHFKKEQVKFDCYICNFMTPKRESIVKHINKHFKIQIKFEMNEGS